MIYPILFNYRHGLELAMKWIIVMYGGQGLSGIDEDHDLWKLWKRCREIMQEFNGSDNDDEAALAVEQIIKDFHDLDKGGINLRYPWGKEGRTIRLPNGMIDLENLRDVMEGAANYFIGLDGWLDNLSSAGL